MSARDAVVVAGERRENAQTFGKLLIIACLMFGFGWALIPFYEKFCELTGFNVLTKREMSKEEAQAFLRNTQIDKSRLVSIEFDGNVQGAWRFRPMVNAVQAHPGELVTVVYEIVNATNAEAVGQAIPSYAPQRAEAYFKKLECFCFQQQHLGPLESRKFPVVFVVDPALPKDVDVITLSYTFFEVAGATKSAGVMKSL